MDGFDGFDFSAAAASLPDAEEISLEEAVRKHKEGNAVLAELIASYDAALREQGVKDDELRRNLVTQLHGVTLAQMANANTAHLIQQALLRSAEDDEQ